MSDVVVLSKEVVVTLAMNPDFQDFTWLVGVRRGLRPTGGRTGCRSCPGRSVPELSDAHYQAALASLTASRSAEVPGLKRALGATTLRLPLPAGPVDV